MTCPAHVRLVEVGPRDGLRNEPPEAQVDTEAALIEAPRAPGTANHGANAAVEHAVEDLRVRAVIVPGHSLCGGSSMPAYRHHDASESVADYTLNGGGRPQMPLC